MTLFKRPHADPPIRFPAGDTFLRLDAAFLGYEAVLTVGCRHPVGRLNYFTSHGHELLKAGTRDDDRVTATMRLLGNAHKAASFVFSKFNVKVLALNLEFFRDDYVIHDDLEGCHLKKRPLTGCDRRENFAK
jgi:hypothetical protein